MIGLNEIKTSLSISLPGYVAYKSTTTGSGHRGGTAVLVRRVLHTSVVYMDTGTEDQVWMRMACIPGVLLGFVYVPPSDSTYFSPAQTSAIQERMKMASLDNRCFIIGDMNARFGGSVSDLSSRISIPDAHLYIYPFIPDSVSAPNDNAIAISAICAESKLLVINNLKTADQHFESKLTY